MKTLLTAFVLATAPLAAVAAGCSHDQTAMSCAEGSSYDQETQTCVPVTG